MTSEPRPARAPGSVGRTTARATAWAFLSTGGAKAISLIGLSLLARILAPREFGLLAFAMAYITYAETIGDLGSGIALVYWPDRREDAAQVTFIVNALAGVFWCVLTLFLAPWVAEFFHAPAGVPIVRVLAFSFLIKFLGNTHDALAQKDMRFGARAIPELGLATLKGAIAVVLAYYGFGAWSLVWGHLAGLACWTVLLWVVVPWRPTLRLPRDLFKPMLGYGRGIMIVNILNAVVSDADLAIVGRWLGVTALGLYQMAAKIPETGVMVALWAVSKVLFPAFSRLHAAGEGLKRAFLMATRSVSAITIPASIGLFFLARPIVLAFFGPQWIAAAPILRLLSLYVGVGSLANHAGNVLKATGRAPLLAWLAVLKAAVIVPALLIGARISATAVAGALLITTTLSAAMMIVIGAQIVGASFKEMVRAFRPSFVAGAVLAASLQAWVWIAPQHAASVLYLGAAIVAGAIIYLVVLRLVDPSLFAWALNNLRPAPAPVETTRDAA